MIQKTYRESILNYYIYIKSMIIEEIMNINIARRELEKNIGKLPKVRKADIYFTSNSGCKIIGEIQTGTSDAAHLEQIIYNINTISRTEFGIIFWIASFFNNSYIEIIKEAIKEKNIMFYALKLNDDVNDILEYLGDFKDDKIVENIEVLDNIENLLSIYSCFRSNNYTARTKEKQKYLSDREIKLDYLSKIIREELKDYYKIQYCKSTLIRGYISYGLGKEDISLRVSIDSNDIAKIDLVLNGSKKELYYNLLLQKDKILNEIGFCINFETKYKKLSFKKKIAKDKKLEELEDIAYKFCIMYKFFKYFLRKEECDFCFENVF